MSDSTAYRMAKKAAHLFKRYYGDYPERIGLDIRTRFKEYVEGHGRFLTIIDPHILELAQLESLRAVARTLNVTEAEMPPHIRMTRQDISIGALSFIDPVTRMFDGTRVYQRVPNAVWCEWGSTTVKMSIWFTSNGYDAIIWDEETSHEP